MMILWQKLDKVLEKGSVILILIIFNLIINLLSVFLLLDNSKTIIILFLDKMIKKLLKFLRIYKKNSNNHFKISRNVFISRKRQKNL